jgi:hypothetical protein
MGTYEPVTGVDSKGVHNPYHLWLLGVSGPSPLLQPYTHTDYEGSAAE